MNLTKEDVQEIVRLLDASPFDELRLETDRFKLTLARSTGQHGGWTQETQTKPAPGAASGPDIKSQRGSSEKEKAAAAGTEGDGGSAAVRTPLPGTFYASAKPGAPPFVELGSMVGEDTVIGVIETMKLMNSVTAGLAGEVVEICVANAEPVKPGQVLMRLRPEEA
ncbi:MAG: acetyl-CoA carboxylase [Sphingomonadales bacterium]